MRQVLALLGRGAGAAVLLGSPAVWGADQMTGVARVIDGDTLVVQGVRVRLWAVDAPETDQTCQHASGQTWPCGRAAAKALKERLGGQPVTCRQRDTDRYGRIVAICNVGAIDLGAWLLINGWAIPYWHEVPEYAALARLAKSNAAGLWSSMFDAPSDWRRA